MKQIKLTVLLTVLMSMVGAKALAHDIEVTNADGAIIYYNYINNNTELEVTYKGTSYSTYSNEYTDNVVIPEEVTYGDMTYSVTSIGEWAFRGCSALSTVSINSNAIVLKSYTSDSNFKTIFGSQVKKYIIGNDVTGIGDKAFYQCISLTSVTIGNSVTSIGSAAFNGCSGLTSITIPNSVTSIEGWAFHNCSGLTSVIIGNSVTSIEQYAFYFTNSKGKQVEIISLIVSPTDIDWSVFSSSLYNTAKLYVPQGAIDKYKACEGWKKFVNMEEGTPAGIEAVKTGADAVVRERYTLDGKHITEPQCGLNILKMSDGTTRKVVIR